MGRFSGFMIACMALVVIGGLNWGIVGIWNYNVINAIFHSVPAVARLLYIVIGLASLYVLGEGLFRMSGRHVSPRPA